LSAQLNEKVIHLPQLVSRASISTNSLNVEKKTMDVIFATGSRGLRQSFFGSYWEELSMDAGSVRLDRLNHAAPVLDSHDSSNLDSVIAVVESARIENGQGVASIRFSSDDRSQKIMQKIQEGIITKLSVGYMVHSYEEVGTQDNLPIFRAVDWEPMEVSFVAIPFDDKATVRSNDGQKTYPCKINRNSEGEIMDIEQPAAAEPAKVEEAPAPAAVEAPAPEAPKAEEAKEEVKEEAKEAPKSEEEIRSTETERASEILKMVTRAKFESEFAQKLIAEKVSVDQARAMVLDKLAERDAKMTIDGKSPTVEITRDEKETTRAGIRDAIMHRSFPSQCTLTEEGKIFRGMSLMEMGKEMLRQRGVKVSGLSKSEAAGKLLSRAGELSSADFASLLADVANKSLQLGYKSGIQTFAPFVSVKMVPDFKNINRVIVGEGNALAAVPETGEITYGTVTDSKEVYALLSYAKGIKFTRQSLINDDLGGLTDIPAKMGRRAADLESDVVYAILLNNANMSDSVALFHATHKNLGTTGALSVTTINELRKLGRLQTEPDGNVINVLLKHLIVGPENELAAQQIISPINAQQASNVNPFVGAYNLIVEPRISLGTSAVTASGSTTAFFMAADPSQQSGLEIARLEGSNGPMMVEEIDFDTQGVKMAVWHDFAAKALDHRGLYKNIGA
jgi:phage head maturation protease